MSWRIKSATKTSEANNESFAPRAKPAKLNRSMRSPGDQLLRVQRTTGIQAIARLLKSGVIQAKLSISQPGDPQELKADRVADAVMRMPDSETEMGVSTDQHHDNKVQRMCPACEDEINRQPAGEEEDETIEAKAIPGRSPEAGVETQINSLRSGGRALPGSVRDFFEPRFGYDFSNVRVHTDPNATEAARSVNARAFTLGRDITFRSREYQPNTAEGRRLLAHELTHVIQQGGGSQLNRQAATQPEEGFLQPHSVQSASNPLLIARQPAVTTLQRQANTSQPASNLDCPTAPNQPPSGETDIQFPVNSSFIGEKGRQEIAKVAKAWKDAGSSDEIGVQGFASVDGTPDFNWQLSCDRAKAVETELVRKGVAPDKIARTAHGPSDAAPTAQGNRHAVIRTAPAGQLSACTPPDPALFDVEEDGPRAFDVKKVGLDSSGSPVLNTRQPEVVLDAEREIANPQFRWGARVKLKDPTKVSECFEAGFLQTVRSPHEIDVTYRSSLGIPKLCTVFLPTPIRDAPPGAIANDAWYRGPSPLGANCFAGVVAPPGILPSLVAEAPVKMDDNPGFSWCVFAGLGTPLPANDDCRSRADDGFPVFGLERIEERITFDTWLVVRRKGAPGFDARCYTFLRHASWVKERTVDVSIGGQIGVTVKGGPEVTDHGPGKGASSPDMSAVPANQRARRACFP